MYHVTPKDIRPGDSLYTFSDNACACANNMSNVTNFYIRNIMTGLKKSPSERTENERGVIDTVNGSIPGINRRLMEKYDAKVSKIRNSSLTGDDRNPARKPRADEVVRGLVRSAEHRTNRTSLLYVPFIKQDRD